MPGSNLVPVDQLKIKENQYGTDGAGLPAYQREFIQRFAPYAMLASAQSGIPARFLLAEASIETNWGQSKGAREDNNLFGIKATPGQIAAGVPVSYRDTGENAANGAAYTEKAAAFIKYPSAEAGFNGFVEKLNRTRWADQKALLKHTAENPYAQDNDVEKALAGAFARTSYLTADKIDQTMLDRMARMPADLNAAGFKTAPDFNKATTDLARIAPFDPTQAQNVSEALGGFTDNDYVSPNGIPVTARPRELSGLDQFSDAITTGLEGAGRAVENTFSGFGNAIRGVFGSGAEAASGPPPASAPGPYDFAGGLAAGGDASNGSFGTGITPSQPAPAPGPYDFAGGLAAGGNVPNGSFGDGITQPGAQPAPTLAPSQVPTIGAGPEAAAVPFNGFDAKAYLAANPDVAASATYANNPLQHFLDFGFKESRTLDPQGHQITQGVDFNRYLADNPDVAAARIDPLAHYLVNGASEGRTLGPGALASTIGAPASTNGIAPPGLSPLMGPSAGETVTASPGLGPYDFSSAYLQANPDVARAGMNAFEHYARYGAKEGRAIDAAGDRFDPNAYLSQNVDVLNAGQDALTHYLTYGANEGRAAPLIGPDGTVRNVSSLGVTPTITASLMPYLQPQGTAPTLPPMQAQTIGAPSLSSTFGPQTASTIGPSAGESVRGFDPAAYLQANPDVAASARYSANPLEHYETYGFNENRALDASGLRLNQTFDGNSYLGMNPDVARAGMNPLDHYLRFGMQEGRLIGAPGATPWVMPDMASTLGAQQAPTLGAQTAPTIGPSFAQTIGAPAAIQATSPSYSPTLSPYGFGQNVSQGVQPGNFGSGISPTPQISPYGFSGGNFGAGIGAQPQSFGGAFGISSAVSNMDAAPSSSGIGDYSFGSNSNVSGYDANQGSGGGGPTPEAAPVASAGWGEGAAAGFDEKGSELAYLRGQEQGIRDANESARLLGQQITSVAPGNQTNYALGAINTPIAPIQHTPFTPVNMSGVFAPLATAAFMPRSTF